MNQSIGRLLVPILSIAACAIGGAAQQSTNGKSVPGLSSDGVMSRRNASDSDWTRYEPEGFGLSFELPGEPFERSYPVPPELQSRILRSKVLVFQSVAVSVNIAHIVFNERVNLKWVSDQIQTSLNPKYASDSLRCPKVSLVTKANGFLLSASCSSFGNELEMQSLIIGSGEHAWIVSVQSLREDRQGTVISRRVLDSAVILP